MLSESTLICVHGYGVRGFFWDRFAQIAKLHYKKVCCPDLAMISVNTAIDEIRSLCRHESARSGHGVVLLGHSLGAVLCTLAAQGLTPSELQTIVAIAAPFGFREREMPAWLRFLLFKKLIPDFIIRRRFFGRKVKANVQKDLFSRAVKETVQFQLLISQGTWFHNDLVQPMPNGTAIAISSAADQIVPCSETAAMAAAMACPHIVFSKMLGIGHDDFGVSPEAATLVIETIKAFRQ